jgi:hypothetical protein
MRYFKFKLALIKLFPDTKELIKNSDVHGNDIYIPESELLKYNNTNPQSQIK